MNLHTNLEKNSYTIHIKSNLLHNLSSDITPCFKGRTIALITDEVVAPLYAQILIDQLQNLYDVHLITLASGEQEKNLTTVATLYDKLAQIGMSRSDLIITLGGGVIGDMGGFVASTYLRGIAYVQIPTTLLAQVDAAVGGKVGVNLPAGKNLIGSFYQPKAVLIDPQVLTTLTNERFYEGMAEVIKYGCIKDADFFAQLESLTNRDAIMNQIESIIYTCCAIKKEVVQMDVNDMGLRMLLNFGHTVGHGLEGYFGYGKLSHGEAVAIGMVAITQISEKKGLTEKGTTARLKKLLTQHQLPTEINVPEPQKLLSFMSTDKKNMQRTLNVILLKTLGEGYIFPTDLTFFKELTQ